MSNNKEYYNLVEDILNNEEYKKLKDLRHHHKSVYAHCIRVSYYSYKVAKVFNRDYGAAARAGLLHDFFLYDWRVYKKAKKRKMFHKHGSTHPFEALKNANEHFVIGKIEEDMITKHMFPLTMIPPRYVETWIIVMVDKYAATKEYKDALVQWFKKKRKKQYIVKSY